jgi:hypothetical protein
VVEAYWIGNPMLLQVPRHDFGVSIDDRFRRRANRSWDRMSMAVPRGCANHAFHVLVASPWVGLLRQGIVDDPLRVMDACRISWGRVIDTDERGLVVRRSPMIWTGSTPQLSGSETVSVPTLVDADVGDAVALHWGWACERLSPAGLDWLRWVTETQLGALAEALGAPRTASTVPGR